MSLVFSHHWLEVLEKSFRKKVMKKIFENLSVCNHTPGIVGLRAVLVAIGLLTILILLPLGLYKLSRKIGL